MPGLSFLAAARRLLPPAAEVPATLKPILFCLSRTVSGDCTRMLFGLLQQLQAAGLPVQAASWGRSPVWMECRVPFRRLEHWSQAFADQAYDRVILSNAHLIPMVLHYCPDTPVALLCQGYDSYYYGNSLAQLYQECPALQRLHQLPVSLLALSRSIQTILRRQTGRDSHYLPPAFDPLQYRPAAPAAEFRVLMAGAPRAPYKGMADGFAALAKLSNARLVLLSPETRPSLAWQAHGLEAEVHYLPSPAQRAEVMASCHAYCCSSWYEGHDLTTLEAMASGLPVVSTRNQGVEDYGRHGQNLLLVEPAQPQQLAAALEQLQNRPELVAGLRREGLRSTQNQYGWKSCLEHFLSAPLTRPGPTDPQEMAEHIHQLERDGLHTPLAVHRLLEKAAADPPEPRQLRRQLKPLLANPRAQYYESARNLYDQAGMRLASWC